MKIVIIEKEEGLGFGGITIHNSRLQSYCKKLGHQVFIIRFTNSSVKEDGVYKIPYYIAEKRTFIFVPSEKTDNLLRKYLKKIKPDVVHLCLGISPFDLFIPSICHEYKIPIVGILHMDISEGNGPFSLISKSIFIGYLSIIKQLDSVILFSDKLKNFYIKRGIDHQKIYKIPNGVDTSFFSPGPSVFKKKYRIKTGILFLGRLTHVKNPEILIKSFLELNTDHNTKLVIAGSGDLENDLLETYNDPRIIYTGMIKDDKTKVDVIRACNIFVLPSSFEGMSLALLEAMSTGLACIATDVGAHPDLLKNTGIILPYTKLSHSLPAILQLLLNSGFLQKSLGTMSRRKILKFYSNEIIMPKYLALYKTTIADYLKRGQPQSKPIDIKLQVGNRLEKIWEKAKKFGINYLSDLVNS